MISSSALDSLLRSALTVHPDMPNVQFDHVFAHMYKPSLADINEPIPLFSDAPYVQVRVRRNFNPIGCYHVVTVLISGKQMQVAVPADLPLDEQCALLMHEFRGVFPDLVESEAKPKVTYAHGPNGEVIAYQDSGKPFMSWDGAIGAAMNFGPELYAKVIQTYDPATYPPPGVPNWEDSGEVLEQAVPGLASTVTCPVCVPCTPRDQCTAGGIASRCTGCGGSLPMHLGRIVIHLNDHHRWARVAAEAAPGEPNIADWLEEYALLNGIDLTFKTPEETIK